MKLDKYYSVSNVEIAEVSKMPKKKIYEWL